MSHIEHEFKHVRLALIFKDFAAWVRSSCVGLNVAGFTTAKYLRHRGIDTVVFPVRDNIDIVTSIDHYNETHEKRLTHVVISAPWVSIHDMKSLIENFSDIEFVVLSHSNVGFLQADPYGTELFRRYAELSKTHKNFKVGGNCIKFAEWFKTAYKEQCICLPNIYPVERIRGKIWKGTTPIKIGAFGAIRPEKNFMTAAAAAVAIQSILEEPVELHMSTGGDGCQSTTLPAIEQMTDGIKGFTLVRHDWNNWDEFIKLVAQMDLMIQPSFTESFNMVTADGVSVGVPSVVSPVIFWAPDFWKVDSDDAMEIALKGMDLLNDDHGCAASDALRLNNDISLSFWFEFLKRK